MIKLRDGELADILPTEFTRQPEVVSISYALKQSYQALLTHQDAVYVYAFVDGAPEYVLDLLAVELKVRYYDVNYSLEVKRRLIKTAMLINSKDGTPYAVNTVIQNLFGGTGRIQEWWEYGGQNNHFRIDLYNADSYDVGILVTSIETVKRKSSKLDSFMFHLSAEDMIYIGMLILEDLELKADCEIPEEFIEDDASEGGTDEPTDPTDPTEGSDTTGGEPEGD